MTLRQIGMYTTRNLVVANEADSIVSVKSKDRDLAFWDTGMGVLWLSFEPFGLMHAVRARTYEEACEALIDECLSDPVDDDDVWLGDPADGDLNEGYHVRGSGVPSNPNLHSPYASEDLNGWHVQVATDVDMEALELSVTGYFDDIVGEPAVLLAEEAWLPLLWDRRSESWIDTEQAKLDVTGPNAENIVIEPIPFLLWVDDERLPPLGWTAVKTAKDAISYLDANEVTRLSLDHDLGDDANGTGYDVAVWIEERVALHGYAPPRMSCHSANPTGRARINQAIGSIDRLWRAKIR